MLQPWMRIGQPLEAVVDDYERIFDAWQAGGLRGLVFGRLLFADDKGGFTIPAFTSLPGPYEKRGLRLEAANAARDAAKEKRLHAMLDDAKKRGWGILIFSPAAGSHRVQGLPLAQDPYGAQSMAAAWEDIFTAFPQADGGLVDGWTESSYELIYHHGNAVFRDLRDNEKVTAEARGWDPARLDAGRAHLHDRFHSFTSRMVGYYGDHGFLQGINLFDLTEDALYWLRWRRDDGLALARACSAEIRRLPRKLLIGNGLRSAVFSGMTAIDYARWDEVLDIYNVKHYFWHRGFDGLYGTVARWVQQIHRWNPGLTERECFTVARAWLGVHLPQVESRADMELGFPQAFFDEVVREETARALAAVSDYYKIMPWVDTGRMPHAGDPMTAGDLYRILTASAEVGLQRFLFHNHGHLTAAEWKVITRMCGTEWDEDPKGYWPPATPRPETFG